MTRKLRTSAVVTIALAIALAAYTSSYAIQSFYKQLSGVGNVDYNAEVAVTDIKVTGKDKVMVDLESTNDTKADYVYTVTLFLDYDEEATDTVSWASGSIPGGKEKVTFDRVDLSGVNAVGAEVTR